MHKFVFLPLVSFQKATVCPLLCPQWFLHRFSSLPALVYWLFHQKQFCKCADCNLQRESLQEVQNQTWRSLLRFESPWLERDKVCKMITLSTNGLIEGIFHNIIDVTCIAKKRLPEIIIIPNRFNFVYGNDFLDLCFHQHLKQFRYNEVSERTGTTDYSWVLFFHIPISTQRMCSLPNCIQLHIYRSLKMEMFCFGGNNMEMNRKHEALVLNVPCTIPSHLSHPHSI